ncbi:hypothetical protein TNCV_1805041 [Trichonephila clavipes]|nr:hypothetical protein TNCV_1805041 [Trichonephila clavipes]
MTLSQKNLTSISPSTHRVFSGIRARTHDTSTMIAEAKFKFAEILMEFTPDISGKINNGPLIVQSNVQDTLLRLSSVKLHEGFWRRTHNFDPQSSDEDDIHKMSE